MTITIRRRRYRITTEKLYGQTTYDRAVGEIWISSHLRRGTRVRVETILHEGLHASFPDMPEDVIAETARDLARLLAKLGEVGGEQ